MDDPSIPGFRSLTQAGIQLREGEGLASSTAPPEQAAAVSTVSPQPEGSVSERRSRGVALQPREPGTKRPLPRDQYPQAMPPQASAPPGIYMGQMPALQFSCPCCGVVLTITDPSAYRGQPGPCPGCSAVVMPPQVVSPFALAAARPEATKAENNGNSGRHYSGFVV